MTMSKTTGSLTSIAIVVIVLLLDLSICNGFAVESSAAEKRARAICSGTIGECLTDSPLEMESEVSRRVLLMQKRYISYETLKRDIVPCMKPGASYYSCSSGQANPYTRGCEIIAGCRS